MESGKNKKQLMKVLVSGSAFTGKTCVMSAICKPGVPFKAQYRATIGADFLSVETENYTLQVWDTAGQERFTSLGTAFYRGTDMTNSVCDDRATFKELPMHIEVAIEAANNS